MTGASAGTHVHRAELRAALAAAKQAGDEPAEVEAHQELAVIEAASGRMEEAKKHARAAEALHVAAGRGAEAALAAYVLGILEARVPEAARQASATLERALAGFRTAGQEVMAGRALGKLSAIAGAGEDFAAAAALLAEADVAYRRGGDEQRRTETLRLRALVLMLAGRRDEAFASMGSAVELASAHGSADLALALRLDRVRLFADDPTAPELDDSAERVLSDAEQTGLGIPVHVQVDQAAALVREGRGDEALAAAEAAADAAMDAVDPIAYLLACLVRVDAHELRGDLTEALASLFQGQANLGELLGEAAQPPVLAYISSLVERWGEPAFDAALLEYRARVDAAPNA